MFRLFLGCDFSTQHMLFHIYCEVSQLKKKLQEWAILLNYYVEDFILYPFVTEASTSNLYLFIRKMNGLNCNSASSFTSCLFEPMDS